MSLVPIALYDWEEGDINNPPSWMDAGTTGSPIREVVTYPVYEGNYAAHFYHPDTSRFSGIAPTIPGGPYDNIDIEFAYYVDRVVSGAAQYILRINEIDVNGNRQFAVMVYMASGLVRAIDNTRPVQTSPNYEYHSSQPNVYLQANTWYKIRAQILEGRFTLWINGSQVMSWLLNCYEEEGLLYRHTGYQHIYCGHLWSSISDNTYIDDMVVSTIEGLVTYEQNFYVRDSVTLASIEGAMVQVGTMIEYTNQYGMAYFPEVPAGPYPLIVSAEGYETKSPTYTAARDYTHTVALVPITAPPPVETIITISAPSQVNVATPFIVSGKLTDSVGNPLTGQIVDLMVGDVILDTILTDTLGNYEGLLQLDTPGSYVIVAVYQGTTTAQTSLSVGEVTPPPVVASVSPIVAIGGVVLLLLVLGGKKK